MASEAHLIVHRRDKNGAPQMAETLLTCHRPTAVTAAEDLFIVHHYDPPPADAVELGQIALRSISGDSTSVTIDQLRAMAEHRRVLAMMECAGNGRRYLRLKAPGTQFGRGLCGAGWWEGVRLRDVLEAFDMQNGFEALVVRGLDSGWATPENKYAAFAKGLPPDKALHSDTLLAWSLNDAPLPHDHGGPLRLVVPGWVGVWWVKWVCEIACMKEEFHGFWQHERYRYVGGGFNDPEVVREQLPRALILSPADGEVLDSRQVVITGKAWSGQGAVRYVEVSMDGGATWEEAELDKPQSEWNWIDWQLSVELGDAPLVVICARATDATGATQDWESRRNDLGYGNNDIMYVTVAARTGGV